MLEHDRKNWLSAFRQGHAQTEALENGVKAWLDVAEDFKNGRKKAGDVIYGFYASKGYKMASDRLRHALSRVEVNPGFPDLKVHMQNQAEILVGAKTINTIPDWSKALRPDFMEKAKSAA